MFVIEYSEDVADDLSNLPTYWRRQILDCIEEQLTYQPTRQTRNKKILIGLIPPWEHMEPVWGLRIEAYRVFYDVNEKASIVTIRAIRYKPPHKTTEEIL